MQQIPLALGLRDDATFDSFLPTGANAMALQMLRALAVDGDEFSLLYLHGPRGSGRSHLLQALCHEQLERGYKAQYLPLAQLGDHPAYDVLASLEGHSVICIDDLECVAGQADWERELFNLVNHMILVGGVIVVAASRPPGDAGFKLPDLVSRLRQGLVLALPEPADEDKARVFAWRGRLRGMSITERVARFVLTHSSRDLHGLMQLLDELDAQSLTQQRRITVPFIREHLDRRHSPG